jgi:hypothetical protein
MDLMIAECIDEISTKKGHTYLTVVMDLQSGAVVFVGDGKGARRGVVHPGWGGSLGPQHRQRDGTVAVWVSQPLMGSSGSAWMQRLLPSTLASEMNVITDLRKCPRLIQRWTRKWNATAITEHVECEWSSRLRRSLGLAYPERMLVRLSLLLKEPKYLSEHSGGYGRDTT